MTQKDLKDDGNDVTPTAPHLFHLSTHVLLILSGLPYYFEETVTQLTQLK